jgi:hypothetical protein
MTEAVAEQTVQEMRNRRKTLIWAVRYGAITTTQHRQHRAEIVRITKVLGKQI